MPIKPTIESSYIPDHSVACFKNIIFGYSNDLKGVFDWLRETFEYLPLEEAFFLRSDLPSLIS